MVQHSDAEGVLAAWNRYVGGAEDIPPSLSGVRQEIVDSWRRSKGKIDPYRVGAQLTHSQLLERQKDNVTLIEIARPYLKNLFEYLRETGYQLTIVDKTGCILDTIFDDTSAAEMPAQFRVGNGSLFAESKAGTNGIGLCLLSGKPTVVYGAEHFKKDNHDSVCYTVPIHDYFHKLLGLVDLSGPIATQQASAFRMLQSSAQSIERELSFRQTNAVLTSTLDAFSSGILVIDGDKLIIHHNAKARNLLGVGSDPLIGQDIFSVLRQDSLPPPARSLGQEISSMECTILNRYQKPLDVLLTVIPSTQSSQVNTTLLTIEAQSELARLAYRGSGHATHYTFDSILGQSPAMESLKSLCRVAAATSLPVLISGESGVGKEVIAQAIHSISEQERGPFVSIDCSKLPRGLLESELFGYEGGVFCGGKENGYMGKLEQANGGTLFLDEINYLPQDIQEQLVHILQTGQVTRLGGKYAKSISIKLIVTTTTNLLTAVQRKTFRSDLYYRLCGLTITVPPLRERQQDILPTASFFIEQACFKAGKPVPTLDHEVLAALTDYDWPHNIRELENVMEEAVLFAETSQIGLGDLPTYILSAYYAAKNKPKKAEEGFQTNPDVDATKEPTEPSAPASQNYANLQDYQRLLDALRQHQGNVKSVAKSLDMPLSTLYYKIKKYGLKTKNCSATPS